MRAIAQVVQGRTQIVCAIAQVVQGNERVTAGFISGYESDLARIYYHFLSEVIEPR